MLQKVYEDYVKFRTGRNQKNCRKTKKLIRIDRKYRLA